MTHKEIYDLLKKIDNGYKATDEEYRALSSVKSISWKDIKDLPESMKLLSGLRSLGLREIWANDIKPLSDLVSLTDLTIVYAPYLTDIESLSTLTGLSNIYLYLTGVKSINSLSHLSELQTLAMDVWSETDISGLEKLTSLKSLNLNIMESCDLSPLSKLTNLVTLNLNTSRVAIDIEPVSALTTLTTLILSGMVVNVSAIQNIVNLKQLRILGAREIDCSLLLNLSALKVLHLDATLIDLSELPNLPSVTELILSSENLKEIGNLSNLSNLEVLHVSGVQESDFSVLRRLTALERLIINRTKIKDVNGLKEHQALTDLDLSYNCELKDISALSGLVNLQFLDLRKTSITDVSALSELRNLKYLVLRETDVTNISALSGLKNLEYLDLSLLHIDEIPEKLLDLDLDFVNDDQYNGKCIRIFGINLKKQPVEIFSQTRELIRAYYGTNGKVPINECKVIFLGDAESGKTYSIKRLTKTDEELADFDGDSTPGIEISVGKTTIEGSEITINYWDFGGQEIQHSMHRMFLTERTVYVVYLNARQDPLDERARYWLENIKSFAPDAPVFLVINKIDQNARPTFNEAGLRNEYKNQIKDIVRISAKENDRNTFISKLQGGIDNIIKDLATTRTMVPMSWKSLMGEIRNMPNYYMSTAEFKESCKLCNIDDYEKIHEDLVDLFQVIGISFSYHKDRAIADYMLLDPQWLVNALYIIVSNSKLIAKNGVISQSDLYDVLEKDDIDGTEIKRVVKNLRYTGNEVSYILGVVRMFRLSYQLHDGSEFFPMLCDGNEKVSVEKVVSENSLHYIFKYRYLPANVMHRLIVDQQRDLDSNFVWYSGAVFRDDKQGQIAHVHFKDNKLHIYGDSAEAFYSSNEYLSPILKNVRDINAEMGLDATLLVSVSGNEGEGEYPFESLKKNLDIGNNNIYIENVGVIDVRKALSRYKDNQDDVDKHLLDAIIRALSEMQDEPTYYDKDEDTRNRFVSQQLRAAHIYSGDQQSGGTSETGKSVGARDGVINDMNYQNISIFEGLNLQGFDKNKITKHLDKLLINYNPGGLPYIFMISYLKCTREKYVNTIRSYINFIATYAPNTYRCVSSPVNIPLSVNRQFLKCFKMDYECGEIYYTIYHIVVRIGA